MKYQAMKGLRHQYPLSPMCRLLGVPTSGCAHVVQQCFGLSDEGMEDVVYDSQAIRRFIDIDLTVDVVPDATTLLKFRRLLKTRKLIRVVFDTINGHLAEKGLLLREGTIVYATIIAAPSSTKNQTGERDADMHQTKKGKTWHLGMKAHLGVDADSGLTHTVVTTAANIGDVTQAHALLRGEETYAFGDARYTDVAKRDERQGSLVRWHVAMKPSKWRLLPDTPLGQLLEKIEQAKTSVTTPRKSDYFSTPLI